MYSLEQIYESIDKKTVEKSRFIKYRPQLTAPPELLWKNYELFLDKISMPYKEWSHILQIYMKKKHNCRYSFSTRGLKLHGFKTRYEVTRLIDKFTAIWFCNKCYKPDMKYTMNKGLNGVCRACKATKNIKL